VSKKADTWFPEFYCNPVWRRIPKNSEDMTDVVHVAKLKPSYGKRSDAVGTKDNTETEAVEVDDN
jgi:hypothetical protein